ncbi:MAG: F0F1 ATP synthase subunit A [Eubacterium sp.]|nr:F0F1 ATP synthase subunit A [Eubacterium sp.]
MDLGAELAEELNIEEVFSFTVAGHTVSVDESTVVSVIITVVMTVLALFLTRGLKVEGPISKRQALLETLYLKFEDFFKGMMEPSAYRYIPWLMSVALFIGVSNIIGIFGLKPPTKSMQVTAVMALTSIVLIEYAGIRAKGIGGRIKAFAKPIWIITPINILELFTKPLSLCMRLFGNVLAAFTIMELIKIATKHLPLIPVLPSLYFDIFDGILQAYIFVFLTAIYIKEAVEIPEEEPKKEKKTKKRKKA